jgi:hypothetical protein
MSYTDETSVEDLSFYEILIEAIIANSALSRSLPKSNASDAIKARLEILKAEARRRDAQAASQRSKAPETPTLATMTVEELDRHLQALSAKPSRRRTRKEKK